jgi:Ca-activated chloride channel family protein
MDLQFVHPMLLLTAPLVLLVGVWWLGAYRRRENVLERFVSRSMQKKLRPAASKHRLAWQIALVSASLLLCVIAVARPQWGIREETIFSHGRDLVIVLDVSRSMLATDVHPNRLQRAKTDIVDLIKELRGDRAALIAFRNRAIALCPLTTDYAYVMQALDACDIDAAPRGETDIGNAIRVGMDTFDSYGSAHMAMILISDGEDLKGDVLTAAAEAAERGITIFTVGLGSPDGTHIPDSNSDDGVANYKGEPVVTRLENDTLYEVAKITGGAYIPVGTASMASTTLGTLYRDYLRNISARDIEESLQRRHVDRFQWFLFPAVILLIVGACLSRGRLRSRGIRHPSTETSEVRELKDLSAPAQPLKNISAAVLFVATVAQALAQDTNAVGTDIPTSMDIPPGREGARAAQKFYRQGDYESAASTYLQAAKGATQKSQLDFQYNAAVAFFEDGQHKKAAELLRELSGSSRKHQTRAATGLGTALYHASAETEGENAEALKEKAKLMRESAESFRKGARNIPEDDAALRNVAVSMELLKAQEEEATIAELVERYQASGPEEIAADMLKAQRDVIEGLRSAHTNQSPSRVYQLEQLADQQRNNAELWIPLKGKLLAALQQEGKDPAKSMAEMNQVIEATRDSMIEASGRLRNLDPDAGQTAQMSEAAVYQLWKSIAPFQGLLQEDIRRQTNAIMIATGDMVVPQKRKRLPFEQEEARQLTRLFAERFEQVAPVEKPATQPSSTNQAVVNGGDIDPETHAKIIDLAMQAEVAQGSALEQLATGLVEKSVKQQRLSYGLLREIEELLPKPPPQQSSQEQQQNNPQQQDEEQESEQEQSSPTEDEQDQQPEEEQELPPQPEEAEQEKEEEEKEEEVDIAEQKEPDEFSEDELERMLEKALQREKEHEAEKRRRNQNVPLTPRDRDW